MKKLLAIMLALVLVLSLCACKKGDKDQNADKGTTQSETGITNSENTETSSESTEESTEGTDGTDGTDETPETPDTNTNTACTHEWKAATCTAPKTCSKCKATEGSAAGHAWKAATCTAPKTCSVCGATEGSKIAHSLTATCTMCGQANAGFVAVDNAQWSFFKNEDGKITEGYYSFYSGDGAKIAEVGYTFYLSFEKFAQEYEMTVDQVRAEYDGTDMCEYIDGVPYVYDGWGMDNWSSRRYKEENGVVTVEFLSLDWDENDNEVWTVEKTVVLKRTGLAELTITSSEYEDTPVGLKLTGKPHEY